jgi:hypothetical protein
MNLFNKAKLKTFENLFLFHLKNLTNGKVFPQLRNCRTQFPKLQVISRTIKFSHSLMIHEASRFGRCVKHMMCEKLDKIPPKGNLFHWKTEKLVAHLIGTHTWFPWDFCFSSSDRSKKYFQQSIITWVSSLALHDWSPDLERNRVSHTSM